MEAAKYIEVAEKGTAESKRESSKLQRLPSHRICKWFSASHLASAASFSATLLCFAMFFSVPALFSAASMRV